MIVLAVVLLGFISFSRLGTDLMPEMDSPRLFVEVNAGQRPPAEIEKQLVSPMEALMVRQKGVTNVSSRIVAGRAYITAEYAWKTDMDQAFLELQKILSPYSSRQEVEELNLSRHNLNADPVVRVALSDSLGRNLNQLRLMVENMLRPELVRIEGVADVALAGERELVLEVNTNPELLQSYGLSLAQVAERIRSFNQNVSGGYIEEKGQRYVVRGSSAVNNPADLENLVVTMAGANPAQGNAGSPVLLKEVAQIKLLESRPTSIVNLNGESTLGVYVYKENRYNTVEVVGSVLEVFDGFTRNNPGIRLRTIENQGEFIQASVNEVRDSALIGIFFAVLVLFFFLRNWGATLVVSIAIPLSVIATFNLMYFNGLTLNLMTLGGLALGAGMLVDNAIVVLENIFRFTEKGEPPNQAAVKGAGGVGGAIVASTLTTIVVFLPIVYLQGVSGELFKDQAWTVAFSLFCSLLVALLVIPLLSTKLLSGRPRKAQPISSSAKNYRNILERALKNKSWVLIITLILTAGSYALLPRIGSSFLPAATANELALEVTLPAGTNLQRTHETLSAMEQSVRRLIPPESVNWIYTHAGPSVGESAGKFTKGENEGTVRIAFTQSSGVVLRDVVEHLNGLFGDVSGLEIQYGQTEPALAALTGDEEAPLIIEVRGPDMNVLQTATGRISTRMKEMPQLVNIYTSFEEEAPEVDIRIDRLKAGMFGLDIQSIISQVRAALLEQDAGSIEEGGNRTEIKVVTGQLNVNDLKALKIVQGEKNYRLSEVAEVVVGREPGQILRDNQSRVGKVYADISGTQPFDQIAQEVRTSVSEMGLPPGYRVVISGDEQRRKESFSQLSFALILAIVLVYMVMASQFESLIHPFTVLLTIPLAGVGTVLAFWLMGLTFNIMAFIGVVMLGGIAVNNSIILVDAINQYKEEGLKLREAVLAAAANRFRPILMTSITTILALLPLAISFGRSASLRAPMAIAVIAGLLSSTLLTLVVIPCVYELFDRSERKQGGR